MVGHGVAAAIQVEHLLHIGVLQDRGMRVRGRGNER